MIVKDPSGLPAVGATENVRHAPAPANHPNENREKTGLQSLAEQIRRDAEHESVFYLIRSNTCCDGE